MGELKGSLQMKTVERGISDDGLDNRAEMLAITRFQQLKKKTDISVVNLAKSLEVFSGYTDSVAVYPNVGNNFLYPTLGLVGELGELVWRLDEGMRSIDKSMDEIGDVCWYCLRLLRELNADADQFEFVAEGVAITFPSLIEQGESPYSMRSREVVGKQALRCSAIICENVKKLHRDQLTITQAKRAEKVADILDALAEIFARMAFVAMAGTEKEGEPILVEIFSNNWSKLKSRQANETLHGDGDNR